MFFKKIRIEIYSVSQYIDFIYFKPIDDIYRKTYTQSVIITEWQETDG